MEPLAEIQKQICKIYILILGMTEDETRPSTTKTTEKVVNKNG